MYHFQHISGWKYQSSGPHDIHLSPKIWFNYHSTDFGDIDGDGDIDLTTVGYGSKIAAWYENDGTLKFTRHILSLNQMAYDTMITDLDGDGDKDILVAGQRSKNVVWFENPQK